MRAAAADLGEEVLLVAHAYGKALQHFQRDILALIHECLHGQLDFSVDAMPSNRMHCTCDSDALLAMPAAARTHSRAAQKLLKRMFYMRALWWSTTRA